DVDVDVVVDGAVDVDSTVVIDFDEPARRSTTTSKVGSTSTAPSTTTSTSRVNVNVNEEPAWRVPPRTFEDLGAVRISTILAGISSPNPAPRLHSGIYS